MVDKVDEEENEEESEAAEGLTISQFVRVMLRILVDFGDE